jgi:hypothetical protein
LPKTGPASGALLERGRLMKMETINFHFTLDLTSLRNDLVRLVKYIDDNGWYKPPKNTNEAGFTSGNEIAKGCHVLPRAR